MAFLKVSGVPAGQSWFLVALVKLSVPSSFQFRCTGFLAMPQPVGL